MTLQHRYERPERFVAGTVGQPGQRTFFLQAREGSRLTSVALEKGQVELLAERLDELLDELAADGVEIADPTEADNAPLDQPIDEEYRVGTMTLAWEHESATIVVEAFAIAEDEDAEPPEVLVVRMAADQARAFARRARSVVSAGRPPCPLCGEPLDAGGHLCPRQNGFRRSRS